MSSHDTQSLSEDEQDSSNLRSSVDSHLAVADGETGAGNEVLNC